MLEDVDALPIAAVDMVAPEVKCISSYELYMNRGRLKYQRSNNVRLLNLQMKMLGIRCDGEGSDWGECTIGSG